MPPQKQSMRKTEQQKELQTKLNWRPNGPCHLRLMHVIVQINEKYIKQDSPLSCTQLDAHNFLEHADTSVRVVTANIHTYLQHLQTPFLVAPLDFF